VRAVESGRAGRGRAGLGRGLGRLLRVGLQVIDAADAVEDVEAQPGLIAQNSAHGNEVRRLDHHERIERVGNLAIDGALIEAAMDPETGAPTDGILIMPGSRRSEVQHLIPFFFTAALAMRREDPSLPIAFGISPFTRLEAVREAGRRTDAKARAKMADPDKMRTVFFLGFELDEQLGDRLAALHPPLEVVRERAVQGGHLHAGAQRGQRGGDVQRGDQIVALAHEALVGGHATNWLGSQSTALFAIMVVTVWKEAGFFMIFYLAALQQIPPDLKEAAAIEGASRFTFFRRVTWPLLAPVTLFILVNAVINAFRTVDHIIVMTRGGPDNATTLLLYYIYQVGFNFWDTTYAAALTTVLLALLALAAFVQYGVLERRTHYQ